MGFHTASLSWKTGMQLVQHINLYHNSSSTPREPHLKGGAGASCCWGWGFWSLGCSSEKERNATQNVRATQHSRDSKWIKCYRFLCLIHSATFGIRTQPQLCCSWCITQDPRCDQKPILISVPAAQSQLSSEVWQKTGAQLLQMLCNNQHSDVTSQTSTFQNYHRYFRK